MAQHRKLSPRGKARLLGIIKTNRWSDSKIARHFEVSNAKIHAIRTSLGLPVVSFTSLTPVTRKRIARMHAEGMSAPSIARELTRDLTTVKTYIQTLTGPVKKKSRAPSISPKKRVHYEKIIRMNRWPDTQIARHFGLSDTMVRRDRVAMGIPKTIFPNLTSTQIKRVLQLHGEKKSMREIVRITKHHDATIRKIITHYTPSTQSKP